MATQGCVLAVDDNGPQRMLIREALGTDYQVLEAPGGAEALRLLYQHRPDLVVLDARMPGIDGWETLRRIREITEIPVIMLTALQADEDVARGLAIGADDYVAKPFSPLVLKARVRAALRRAARPASAATADIRLYDGDLVIDPAAARVWARGNEVSLTRTEFRLLHLLATHLGQVLSPRQILERIWGVDGADETGYVKTYVRMLRGKIERDPSHPTLLLSRRGLGYLLVRTPGA